MRFVIGLISAALLALPSTARAQRTETSAPVPVVATLEVGRQRVESATIGRCFHYAASPGYGGRPAESWSVAYADNDAKRNLVHVRLNVARVSEDTFPYFTLYVSSGARRSKVLREADEEIGRGRATVARAGDGWRFAFEGVAADGTPLKGTITCRHAVEG